MKDSIKYAAINALGTAFYIMLIASFMYFLENSQIVADKTIFGSIAFLMLFVFSAALTGSLVFGRPIMWYLNGKKKEAFYLLFYTLGILLIITLLAVMVLVFRIG